MESLPAAGSDDGDGVGEEHRAHADRLGAVLARQAHRLRALGGLDLEAHRHDAVLDVPVDLVAGVTEDREHLAVLRQHLGDELGDADLLRDDCEVLEHHRADAAALEVVGDVEGHLGAVPVDPVVAGDADDLVADRRHEGDPVDVVDVGEPGDVAVAQLAQRREEPHVDGLVGLPGVEAAHTVGVRGLDGPHVGDRPVPQDHVGLPLHRVPGREHGDVRHAAKDVMPPRRAGGTRGMPGARRRRGDAALPGALPAYGQQAGPRDLGL